MRAYRRETPPLTPAHKGRGNGKFREIPGQVRRETGKE